MLFVPTDFVEGRNTFDAAEPEEALCDWDDLIGLERQGVSVQSRDLAPAVLRPYPGGYRRR